MLGLIHVPYWYNASILEISWLVAGCVTTGFTAVNIRDSWKDRQALRIVKRDPAVHDRHYQMIKLSAHGRLNDQLSRMTISLLIVATGITGVILPNPLDGEITWTGLVVTVALVAIGAITAFRSYFDFRQRNLLYEMALGRTSVLAAKMRGQATDPDVNWDDD